MYFSLSSKQHSVHCGVFVVVFPHQTWPGPRLFLPGFNVQGHAGSFWLPLLRCFVNIERFCSHEYNVYAICLVLTFMFIRAVLLTAVGFVLCSQNKGLHREKICCFSFSFSPRCISRISHCSRISRY